MQQYLWLRYINGATQEHRRFRVTRGTSETETTRVEQTGMRGIEYSHLIAKRKVWSIVVSPDELIYAGAWDFINEFWEAHRWFIADTDAAEVPSDGTFIECVIPQGRLPVEYINNHTQLRQVAFDMRQKKSNAIA